MKVSSNDRIPLRESVPLAVLLFVFWILLSGKLDAFHLGAGLLASLAIGFATCRLYALRPTIVAETRHPFFVIPWLRFATYLPWLAWQIIVASIQVAKLVLRPTLDIDPRLIRFEKKLPHNMARTVLANSITLTPGTVTLDVRADEYLVHALTGEAADSLLGTGPNDMKRRVEEVFVSDGGGASE